MNASTVIGIDLGGTRYKLGRLSGNELTGIATYPTLSHRPVQVVMDEIAGHIGTIRAEIEAEGGRLAAVGIGVPAVIDQRFGRIVLLPNFSETWQGFSVTEALESRVGLSVFLINDARSYTLAESRLGAGRGVNDLLCVTLGTGVGGGIVIDGRLRFGPNLMAGEFGHISIDPHGQRCGCGGLGCIEAYASGPAITAMALRPIMQGRTPILREMLGGDLTKLDADLVARAATAGDHECKEIFERVGAIVGQGIAHVLKIVDVERVVIGGGVAAAGRILLDPIRQSIDRNAAVFGSVRPEIVRASIEQPGATGAALWAREQLHLENDK